jgi:hypothetical protein
MFHEKLNITGRYIVQYNATQCNALYKIVYYTNQFFIAIISAAVAHCRGFPRARLSLPVHVVEAAHSAVRRRLLLLLEVLCCAVLCCLRVGALQ